ncbi:hypothetical protein, partial [Paenibacillus prosopidis]|uniref:hypothetical protein n=1 Tax=Paenibacillus prosopidis TaxID=630520 RepID=UPI0015F1B9B1
LFRERHPGKPGRPLHSGSRHDKAGYDGYDTRMFCSLKTPYATRKAAEGKLLIKPGKSIPLIAARARPANEAGCSIEAEKSRKN